MKAKGTADWLIAITIVAGFYLWTRSKKTKQTKVEVITGKGQLYLVDPEAVATLQARLKATGESIRSIRPVESTK